MESLNKRGCDLGTCVGKALAFKKRIAIISCDLEASLGAKACVQVLRVQTCGVLCVALLSPPSPTDLDCGRGRFTLDSREVRAAKDLHRR